MVEKTHQELAEEVKALRRHEGVKAVCQWTLPNNEVPFDDDKEASRFESEADGYFNLMTDAIHDVTSRPSD